MDSDTIIEIKNLGKKYDLSHSEEYLALRDRVVNMFKGFYNRLKGRLSQKECIWALRNVSLTIQRGEIIGVIGGNGAGKSTLLKLLSRITYPSEGEIKLKGRVGSLLEVGTGFHPELTGRENIYLNGAILGMKKKEISANFNKIVEFSGVEKFLDTPVKHYSSGMRIRLAFSVAAHLDPEILLIDEVLSVGDAAFQKKCLGKLDEVTKESHRTIFFVSHNMGAIQQLCTRCILLEKGVIKKVGRPEEVIDAYLHLEKKNEETEGPYDTNVEWLKVNKVSVKSDDGSTLLQHKTPIIFEIECANAGKSVKEVSVQIHVRSNKLEGILLVSELIPVLEAGISRHRFIIEKHFLLPGKYKFAVKLRHLGAALFYNDTFNFTINSKGVDDPVLINYGGIMGVSPPSRYLLVKK